MASIDRSARADSPIDRLLDLSFDFYILTKVLMLILLVELRTLSCDFRVAAWLLVVDDVMECDLC